jgi:esterase
MKIARQAVELYYEEFGQAGDCPIIILHGFLASSRNWRTVAKNLAKRHHVLVVDMRNHGASPHSAEMDYPTMANDILSLMDKLGVQRVHLLGHSMGGKIAMWFALHYPERVSELMIADIAPVNYQHSFDQLIQALKSLPLERLNNRKDAEHLLADAIPDLSFRQFLLQNLLLKDGSYDWRINLDYIGNTSHHVVAFPDIEDRTYSGQALFVAGERSAYIQPDSVMTVFPQAEIVEIPETGHWLYVEAPGRFCEVIDDWVCRHSR